MRTFDLESFVKNEIPLEESFHTTNREFEEELRKRLGKGIIGSISHGSFRSGNHKKSSDIDYLILTEDISIDHELKEIAFNLYKKSFVPIEYRPVDIEQAKIGAHTVSKNFHMMVVNQENPGIVGRNPIKLIKPTKESVKEAALEDMKHYYSKVKNRYNSRRENHEIAELLINSTTATLLELAKVNDTGRINTRSIFEKENTYLSNEDKQLIENIYELRRKYDQILDLRSEGPLTQKMISQHEEIINSTIKKYEKVSKFINNSIKELMK